VVSLCAITTDSLLAADRPNVLVIAADDLRDELGCYGADHIHSPNIDALAARGTLFTRAYSQYAVCGPSRASVFTGARPDSVGVYNNKTQFRQTRPDIVSLPQHFKSNGYHTGGFGKVLHDTHRDPVSWSEPYYFVEDHNYALPENRHRIALIDGVHEANASNPMYEAADAPDHAYRDGMITDKALAALRRVAKKNKPFFLMIGYHKPHTPFNAPKKYWDLYDRDKIALADNPYQPHGAPDIAMNGWRYFRSFKDMPKEGPMPDATARTLRHAYYACISYVDAQVGKLTRELESLGVDDNTIVVFWSDHGYQLGEHGMWCKHTNFETSTRVPFIVVDPRQQAHGGRTDARVELVDMFPTLADLCGLPAPNHLDGKSVRPLLDNPTAWDSHDTIAFSQFFRGGAKGVSMRTGRFRYTEWRSVKDGRLVARELYDHHEDPHENRNRFDLPEYAAYVDQLAARLQAEWPKSR
jgi:choline-sulfatase